MSPGICFRAITVAKTTKAMIGYLAQEGAPRPVGSGRMKKSPMADVANATSSMPVTFAKEDKGEPMFGDTCSVRMLFIFFQLRKARGIRKTNQMKPAL